MDKSLDGWLSGFLGVLIFSGSLPATRLAVADFDPVFLTLARAAIAGLCAGGLLILFRQARPAKRDLLSLLIVSLGVIVGFPLQSAGCSSRAAVAMTGSDSTKAQEITCQPPKRRDRAAPSA